MLHLWVEYRAYKNSQQLIKNNMIFKMTFTAVNVFQDRENNMKTLVTGMVTGSLI